MAEAAAGGRFPDAPAQYTREQQQLRDAFFEQFPEMRAVAALADRIPQIQQLLERFPQVASAHNRIFDAQASESLDSVTTEVAKAYGLDTLNPFQLRAVHGAFVAWLQNDPQLANRYERGDRRLVGEFVTAYKSGFIDPMSRTAEIPGANRAARNAGLPGAPRGGGAPAGTPPPRRPRGTPLTEADQDKVFDDAFAGFDAAVRGSRP